MKKYWLTFFILFVLLYLGTLGFRPLFTPDETRYGEIARELVNHHDWVVPKINNLKYFEKPIMGHWANALSLKLLGKNLFAVRIASALSTLLAALLLFWLVAKNCGKKTGTFGSSIFLTCGIVYGVGTFAVLDPLFSLFTTGTMCFFFLALHQTSKRRYLSFIYLAMMGISVGLAFMTKGLLAIAIPGCAIFAFLCGEKRWRQMLSLPWIPALFAVLTAAPWSYLIYKRSPDFWHYFIVVEHWQRFFQDVESQHPEPFWYFIPVIIGGLAPWIFILPSAMKGLKHNTFSKSSPSSSLMRYLACWVIFPFILFSASSGKLATYILPCFPALAGLLGIGFKEYFTDKYGYKFFNTTCKYLKYFLVILLLAVCCVQILGILQIIPDKRLLYSVANWEKWAFISLALLLWVICLHRSQATTAGQHKFNYFVLGAIFIFSGVHFCMPDIIVSKKAPVLWLSQFKNRIKPNTIIVSYKNLLSSVCWAYDIDNVFIYHKGGELKYGLNQPGGKGRLLKTNDLLDLVNKQKKHIIVIMNSKRKAKELPAPDFKNIENGNYFMEYNCS